MRFELKTIGIVAVTHNSYTICDPHSLNDKLTFLFELRQDRHIRSHFQKESTLKNAKIQQPKEYEMSTKAKKGAQF